LCSYFNGGWQRFSAKLTDKASGFIKFCVSQVAAQITRNMMARSGAAVNPQAPEQ